MISSGIVSCMVASLARRPAPAKGWFTNPSRLAAHLGGMEMPDEAREARLKLARHLAELHRLHLAILADARGLKRFTAAGRPLVEVELTADLLEQYLSAGDAFLENMRGRMEARLGLLRRGEPQGGGKPEDAPGHGGFWLIYSRLCAVLRRLERR